MNSMGSVLFANIGTRDIGSGLTPIFSNSGENIFSISKDMCNSTDRIKDMNAMFLEPVINEIRHSAQINEIYLFGTFQNPPHRQDTYFIAKIVKDILSLKYGFDNDFIKIETVKKDPSNYDEMYKFYSNFLDMNAFENVGEVFVSATGGAPAQNFSLIINSVYKLKNKVSVVYLPRYSTEPIILRIGHEIAKSLMLERFEELKSRHMFRLASEIAEKYALIPVTEIKYIHALSCKNNFDFESSIKLLMEIKDYMPSDRKLEIEVFVKKMQLLTREEIEELSPEYFERYIIQLEELYENMKVKWENGEYVDFLGRLFRFQESALRIVFELFYKTSTDKKENEGFTEFENKLKSIMNTKEFIDFMAKDKIKMKADEPNTLNLNTVLSFLCYTKKDKNLAELKKFLDTIQKLSELRNYSIIAHGYRGVSKKTIEDNYKSNEKTVKPDIIHECVRVKDILKAIVDHYDGNNSISP